MSKKLFVPFVLAILASLIFSSAALAQEAQPLQRPHGGRRGVGQVIDVGDSQFTVESSEGLERVLLVDEKTRFREVDGEERLFDDLETGQWVAGIVGYNDDHELVARLVIFLPDDFDLSQRLGRRAGGRITGVNVSESSFTLFTRSGEDLVFQVNENTHYRGAVEGLSDLQGGMVAAVGAIEQDDGTLLAVVLMARFPLVKHAGTVTSVDVSANTFGLNTRSGDDLTFSVDENTRFHSRDGSVQGLDDLQLDMVALVSAKKEANGSFKAVVVGAGTAEQLPKFDFRTTGKVITKDKNSFTVETRNGDQYKFKVTDETHFRSRGDWLEDLDDLEIGMRVMVGAKELGNGQYHAQLVLAGRSPQP